MKCYNSGEGVNSYYKFDDYENVLREKKNEINKYFF